MNKLWKIPENIVEYSAQKTTISRTFGSYKNEPFHYERYYKTLTEAELMDLLIEAKSNCWSVLDLSNCGISSLPDLLWEITTLKVLYLGNSTPDSADNNTFDEISEKIGALQNLEALSFCNITNIKLPKALKTLPHLTYVDCFGCNFFKIPFNLLNKHIKGIGIKCDKESHLLQICKLKRLEELFLTGSSISKLPIEIGDLGNLRLLYLRDSNIERIPESLLNLKYLKKFEIANTPLYNSIPAEIKTQTPLEIISFVCRQQSQQQTYFFNESKMVIVGQGNVGKSCLVERIITGKYEEKESTEGIAVKKWTYNKNRKKYILNIWDFGGQEIYHSTHQFFLTKRSLYILVWDARAEEEYGRIDYWLKNNRNITTNNVCFSRTQAVNRQPGFYYV